MEFLDWTAVALQSLSSDAAIRRELRAYAAWELDYRIAFELVDAEDPVFDAWKAGQDIRRRG
jgi:hypothetical protein